MGFLTLISRRPALIALVSSMALAGGAYQMFLASQPLNDHFMNVVWGREILASRLPVRDFFEAGEPLSELLSASAEAIVGYRHLSEALVVGLASAASVVLVFRVTYGLTGAVLPSVLASALVILAGARSYSYPKVLIYSGAALLIWNYVRRPSRAWLNVLAGWTGVAFLWRHDHGFYMAVATAATVVAAHHLTRTTVVRLLHAGLVSIIVTAPYLGWVHIHRGLVQYVSDGNAVILSEYNQHPSAIIPQMALLLLVVIYRKPQKN